MRITIVHRNAISGMASVQPYAKICVPVDIQFHSGFPLAAAVAFCG
jgi:hypothetical protein